MGLTTTDQELASCHSSSDKIDLVIDGVLAPYELDKTLWQAASTLHRRLCAPRRRFVLDSRELSDNTWVDFVETQDAQDVLVDGRFFVESGFTVFDIDGRTYAVNQRFRNGVLRLKDDQQLIVRFGLALVRESVDDGWTADILSRCNPRPSLGGSFVATGTFSMSLFPSLREANHALFNEALDLSSTPDDVVNAPFAMLFLK